MWDVTADRDKAIAESTAVALERGERREESDSRLRLLA
jgi:hypothetical protein